MGLPSGLGALLVRRDAAAALDKTYFAGGTVRLPAAGRPAGRPAAAAAAAASVAAAPP